MEAGSKVVARPPGQSGPGRGRQVARERDLALGPGEGPAAPPLRRAPRAPGGDPLGGRPRPGRRRARRLGPHRRPRRDRIPRHRLRRQGALRHRGPPDHDIVCVHVEAPDEASHEGRADAKVEALERIDRDIVGPVRRHLESYASVADPHLPRPRDPAADPGPRPRPRPLGDGRDRPDRVRASVRRGLGPSLGRSSPLQGLSIDGLIPRRRRHGGALTVPLLVQKFGGTSVADSDKILAAARRAIRAHQRGRPGPRGRLGAGAHHRRADRAGQARSPSARRPARWTCSSRPASRSASP